ncbi:MAG: hypothetical protein LIP08_02825 [Bacteroides sp.]|nr:hypothetical protein [Bacteroides sp.]
MEYAVLHTAEWIGFLCLAASTGYLLLFALLGCFRKQEEEETAAEKPYRMVVVIRTVSPATDWDRLLDMYHRQTYPHELFKLLIATSIPARQLPPVLSQQAIILPMEEGASDGKVIHSALASLPKKTYDLLLFLDAPATVSHDLLAQINTAYNESPSVLQLHRIYTDRSTYPVLWNAVGEEIRRSISGRGHNRCGLSASLEESGFVLECDWLEENLDELPEDFTCQQLELYLASDRQYIHFQDHIQLRYEEEISTSAFYHRQRRSFGKQYKSFFNALKRLPEGILGLNPDLIDRCMQWAILPPVWLIHLITFMALLTTWLQWTLSLKWWVLLVLLLFALALATPDYLVDKPFNKAMKRTLFYIPGWFLSFFSKPSA